MGSGFDRRRPARVAFMRMLRRAIVTRYLGVRLLVAVAVLAFVGHVCALPHSDLSPGAGAAHSHDHESGEGHSHAHGSCDATVSQGHAATPAAASLVSAVAAVVAVPNFLPVRLATTFVPPSTRGSPAHSQPLFLLHGALLI